jgi:hypothetical protein
VVSPVTSVVTVHVRAECRAAWEGPEFEGAGESELSWMEAMETALGMADIPDLKDITILQ